MHQSEKNQTDNSKTQDFRRLEECFIYCLKQLFSSFHVFSLETLEATLGNVDIGDQGVELVHLEGVFKAWKWKLQRI